MANFYTDNPDLKHHLNHPLMRKIVELKERNYTDAEKFDYAPFNFEDAMDSYDKVLEIVGELCGTTIAENAESVECAARLTLSFIMSVNSTTVHKSGLIFSKVRELTSFSQPFS